MKNEKKKTNLNFYFECVQQQERIFKFVSNKISILILESIEKNKNFQSPLPEIGISVLNSINSLSIED